MTSDDLAVIALTTVPADFDVEALARHLVNARVAACVSALPAMRSVYHWEGAVETADERQLLIKTVQGRVEDLQRVLAEQHPYEVPEFLVVPLSGGGAAYLQWVAASTTRLPQS